MAQKLVIIIGAGIAGLSAGCYGQMNGYRTQIFEMQNKPGGLCTSWERYTSNWRASFEGWLIATKTFGMRMSKTLPGLKNFYMAGQWG